jgi:hypothetical protein
MANTHIPEQTKTKETNPMPDSTTIITLNNLILTLHTNQNKDGGTHQTIEIQTTPKEVNKK